MPWRVRKRPIKGPKDWAIEQNIGGKWKVVGRSISKNKADASVRARRMGSHK